MITRRGGSLYEQREATFSDDLKYRYTLRIVWDRRLPILPVIGLNPSTADEMKNDPTITKICKFAKSWGYGGILMLNLFALRSSKPKALEQVDDPVGDENQFVHLLDRIRRQGYFNDLLTGRADEPTTVLAAWGSSGLLNGRGDDFAKFCRLNDVKLLCLQTNPDGTPTHPLARGKNHIALDRRPIPYEVCA